MVRWVTMLPVTAMGRPIAMTMVQNSEGLRVYTAKKVPMTDTTVAMTK